MKQQQQKFVVVIDGPTKRSDLAIERKALGKRCFLRTSETGFRDEDELIEFSKGADALIHNTGYHITARFIDSIETLRAISCASVGFNLIDIDAATRRGIPVTNVPDYCTNEVADHAMALILALKRQIKAFELKLRQGSWDESISAVAPIHSLSTQVLGLVSFGRIPRQVAKRAQSFGFQVIAFDPFIPDVEFRQHRVVKMKTLKELMRRSDVVSCHVPLSPKTVHLIGRDEIDVMKSTALFVNTGRGKTVDQSALSEALSNGRIAGAGLDVFETEPVEPDDPIFKLENVIVTPHVAAWSVEGETRLKLGAARNVAHVLSGRRPPTVVNPEVYGSRKLHS